MRVYVAGVLALASCYKPQNPSLPGDDDPAHDDAGTRMTDASAGDDGGVDARVLVKCDPSFAGVQPQIPSLGAAHVALPQSDAQFAYLENNGNLQLLRPLTSSSASGILNDAPTLHRPMLTPDGKRLYVEGPTDVEYTAVNATVPGTLMPAKGVTQSPGAAGSALANLRAFIPSGTGVKEVKESQPGTWGAAIGVELDPPANDILLSFNLTSDGLGAVFGIESATNPLDVGTWLTRREKLTDPFDISLIDDAHADKVLAIPLLDATMSDDCSVLVGIDNGALRVYLK